jgi:hypothetical protein
VAGVPETLGVTLASVGMVVLPLPAASLDPPQPARAILSVINANVWLSSLQFFPVFISLAPLFR